jgi:hypothetical protein
VRPLQAVLISEESEQLAVVPAPGVVLGRPGAGVSGPNRAAPGIRDA